MLMLFGLLVRPHPGLAATTDPKDIHHYVVRIQELQDHIHEKGLFEAMVALDPWGEYQMDLQTHELDMTLGQAMTFTDLAAYLGEYGFTVTSFHQLGTIKGIDRTQVAEMPEGFPAFVDTGDPPADDAHYEAAKSAWIAAHPDAYEQLTAPGSSDEE